MNKLKVVACLLSAIIIVIIIGQVYLSRNSKQMVQSVQDICLTYEKEGDSQQTKQKIDSFLKKWNQSKKWLSMMVHHNELDPINEASARLPIYVHSDNPTDFKSECQVLKVQFRHLRNAEKIDWENIF